jgi:hypothetical protein
VRPFLTQGAIFEQVWPINGTIYRMSKLYASSNHLPLSAVGSNSEEKSMTTHGRANFDPRVLILTNLVETH